MDEKNCDVDVLGQKIKYPNSWQGVAGAVLALTVVSITILGVLYLLTKTPADNLRAITSIFMQTVNKNGETISTPGFRIEFWTPSAKTKEYFASTGRKVPAQYLWQVTDDVPERVDKFGKLLVKDSSITGYRRYEVSGEGESGHNKWGWWWVINIKGTYTTEYRDWFIKTYREYWGIPVNDGVYIEIVSAQ